MKQKSKIKNLKINNHGISLGMKLCTFGSMLLITAMLSGCNDNVKEMDCNLPEGHAHKYIDSNGFISYKDSELEIDEGYTWTSETTGLTRELVIMDKLNLLSIKDNRKVLEVIETVNQPYLMYEYSYIGQELDYYFCPRSINLKSDKAFETYTTTDYDYDEDEYVTNYHTCVNFPVYKDVPKTDWTPNPNHDDLTGQVREYSTTYHAYDIVNGNNEERIQIKSKPEDSIFEAFKEYPYFKPEDYTGIKVMQYTLNEIYKK